MSLSVTWTSYAKASYYQEIDFINQKWTTKEVENFIFLIENFIERLSSGIEEGKVYPNTPIFSVVISKQTTVFLENIFRIAPLPYFYSGTIKKTQKP